MRALLAAALVLVSPGLPAYQALAAGLNQGKSFQPGGQGASQTGKSLPVIHGLSLPSSSLPLGGETVRSVSGRDIQRADAGPSVLAISAQGQEAVSGAPSITGPLSFGELGDAQPAPGGLGRGPRGLPESVSRDLSGEEQKPGARAQADGEARPKRLLDWLFDRFKRRGASADPAVSVPGRESAEPAGLAPASLSASAQPQAVPAPAAAKPAFVPLPGETLEDALKRRDRIIYGYIRGQLARSISFAMYYSLFAPLATALAGAWGRGLARSGYSGALAVLSPIAGVLAERFTVRNILVGALAARTVIWLALIPASFVLLSGGWLVVALVGLQVLDGAVVSLATLVDVDEGGFDLLGRQHHFPVDAELRKKYNAVLEGFSAGARILVAPTVALLGVLAAGIFMSAAAVLVGIMALSFGLPALIGAYYYLRYIPAGGELAPPRQSWRGMLSDLKEGFAEAWRSTKLRGRFLMNSIERALENAMVIVLLAEIALNVLAPGNQIVGALWLAVLVAAGRVGTLIASGAIYWLWKAPQDGKPRYPRYKIFFTLTLLGTLAAALLPSAALAPSFAGALAIAALAAFLFHVFFNAAKQGYRSMTQDLIVQRGGGTKLFGIQTTIEMSVDAVLTMALSALFAALPLLTALTAAAALYIAFGVFSRVVGPRWLFDREERQAGALPTSP